MYLCTNNYSTTYHSLASECLQNIRGTDLVVPFFPKNVY